MMVGPNPVSHPTHVLGGNGKKDDLSRIDSRTHIWGDAQGARNGNTGEESHILSSTDDLPDVLRECAPQPHTMPEAVEIDSKRRAPSPVTQDCDCPRPPPSHSGITLA